MPLFGIFTLPVLAGLDVVTLVDGLEQKGWMEWTKKIGVDMNRLIKRVNENDDFHFMQPSDWNGQTVIYFILLC